MPRAFDGGYRPELSHNPNRKIAYDNPIQAPDITEILEELAESLVNFLVDNVEKIPILGDLVKVLKELLDTNGNGHLELEDLLGLLTGRGILDGLAALFGGNNGLPFGDIFAGLQQMFGGLTPGGKFDAAELIGDLPMTIVNTLRGLISAVFDLGLLRITPNMIFGGNSDNLLLASDFKAAESMVVGDGWFWDGVEGRTAPGSAKATASGNRLVQLSNLVRVEEGQKVDVAGWVKWSGVSASGDAFRVECQCYNGASTAASLPVGVISSPAASGGWQQINGQVTVPASVDGVRVRIAVEAAVTAGSVWWDDVTAVRVGTMPQNFITNLIPDLANLGDWITQLVQQGLGALGIPIVGDLLDQILDFAGGLDDWMTDTDATASGLDTLLGGLLSNPGGFLGSIPQGNLPIVSDIIKAVTGFTSGQGAPSGSSVIADMLSALGQFTGSTNLTAITADEANGVGGNALANTVSVQAQVSELVGRTDTGWSARPLWATMDYTSDATFNKHLMLSLRHSHTASFSGTSHGHGVGSLSTGFYSYGSHSHSNPEGGSTGSANLGLHSHSVSGFTDSTTAGGTVTVDLGGPTLAPAVVNATTAFLGYIRCGSVQEKRLFTFLAQASGTVSTFNLDVYRMASDGALTLAYSSANFAGAIGGSLGWVQHTIPAGTASVAVQPGDILAIQLRMTGTGSVALGGITTPLPLNPAGWYPLRESAVRNPSTPAPATIAAATANAQHTSTAIPYIEAGIDTGLANAPISITDNFDGTLSSLWLMQGPNTLGITSNQLGIIGGNSDGYSWGTFRQKVNTDNMKVGFSVSTPTDREQIVWFHGRDRDNHVGLAITNSYATLYTMTGGSRTNRTQIAISSVDASYEIRVSGTAYTVWRNGAQIGSATIASAPSGRSGGVGLQAVRTGWFGLYWYGANPIDNWILADI